jgi:hypothetical protein
MSILLGIDPDLHSLKDLQIFFGEIEAGGFARFIVAGVRPQPDLEPQRQFHLITRFAQTFDRFATFVEFSTDSLIALPISRTISFASSSISIAGMLRQYADSNCQSAIRNCNVDSETMFGTIGILTGGGDAPASTP